MPPKGNKGLAARMKGLEENMARIADFLQMQKAKFDNEQDDNGSVQSDKRSSEHADKRSSVQSERSGHAGTSKRLSGRQRETHDDLEEPEGPVMLSRHYMARQEAESKTLPTFSGDPREWPNFYSQYVRSTKMCAYTDAENVGRLQRALTGVAKAAVYALLALPNAAEEIISTLKVRFGRPDVVINHLLGKLIEWPGLHESDYKAIVTFSTELKNYVATVELLDCKAYLMEPTTLAKLVKKLPNNLRVEWTIYFDMFEDTHGFLRIKELSDWLWVKSHVFSKLAIDMEKDTPPDHKPATLSGFDPSGKPKVPISSRDTGRECRFCGLAVHRIPDCEKWLKENVSNRWKWARSNRLCFLCLRSNHSMQKCAVTTRCGVGTCRERHHQTLHKDPGNGAGPTQTHHAHAVRNQNPPSKFTTVLKVLPVRVHGPAGYRDTYALLDEGSSLTMIDGVLAKELGIRGPVKPLSLAWTGSVSRTEDESELVSFRLSKCTDEGKKYYVEAARTVRELALQPQSVDLDKVAEIWPHVRKGEVVGLNQAVPQVLVGQDNWPLILPRRTFTGPWKGPVVSLTWLGWVLYGNVPERMTNVNVNCETHFQMTHWSEIEEADEEAEERKLTALVEQSMAIDRSVLRGTAKPLLRAEDKEALKIFEATTRKVGDRWETGLLWRSDAAVPESRTMAERRLRSLENRFERDPAFAERYCAKMEENFSKGYARYLSEEEAAVESRRTWYLPHLGVINPNKPQKLRVCFDAAAKSRGYSLNDLLLKGPDLYVSLPGLLLNFRRHKVAFTGDIKEMYPQIMIRKEDQDAQRFLWRGKDKTHPPRVAVMQAMMFGTICSPFAAQEIRTRNALEFIEQFPEACRAIETRHYMDDYVDCVPTEERAIQLVADVIRVHQWGSFVMCNWVTNSSVLQESIPANLRDPGGSGKTKVLGMTWNYITDEFEFGHWKARFETALSEERPPSNKDVLSMVMSLFDPLGLMSNIIIAGRILFQEAWSMSTEWREELRPELRDRWRTWLRRLAEATELSIPRQYAPGLGESSAREVHVFCDASQYAYSACAYLRCETREGVKVTLMCARARVTPLAQAGTIPRLELRGAVMAVELAHFIWSELDMEVPRTIFWSDSQVVLHWIKGAKTKLKPFVANRVAEILESTEPGQWRWVPTAVNPADLATREDCTARADVDWWKGPRFLYDAEGSWPQLAVLTPELSQLELVGPTVFVGAIQLCPAITELPDVRRFSRYERLVRATGWIQRLKWNARNPKRRGELLVVELEEAERLWCLRVQEDSFPKELRALREQGVVTDKGSRVVGLSPFIHEESGLMCVEGRIGLVGGVDKFVRHPIILEPKHRFTQLLVKYYHEQAGHSGQRTVFNQLRQRYWILQGGRAVKHAWAVCVKCQQRRGKTVEVKMGELPAERLEHHVRPFTNVGVDYFGPMYTVVGRRREKRYGALFTCLVTRAVHLELAYDLTTDAALMAIRRFASRRGWPRKIFSDNGTNFVGAARELQDCLAEWSAEAMGAELALHGVEWSFNPPAAPHMGGAWERLVRTVKIALTGVLEGQTPRDEVLWTVLAEVEALVNSRPLTELSLDSKDDTPLTPNHFLIGTATLQPMVPAIPSQICLKRTWRVAQQLTDHFWQRWVKEYLPTLLTRTKWREGAGTVQPGDVVVIADSGNPRGSWPKGVITHCYPGRDGQTRVVDIRTASGVLRRPATKVCPLHLDEGGTTSSSSVPAAGPPGGC